MYDWNKNNCVPYMKFVRSDGFSEFNGSQQSVSDTKVFAVLLLGMA